MSSARWILFCLSIVLVGASDLLFGQELPPVEYRFSFPEPQHSWLAVDVLFPEVDDGPFDIRMSSASPGRYARHDFAKNIIEMVVANGIDERLEVSRLGPSWWRVMGHDGTVRVRYRLFGDHLDGTYLSVDATHAHLNMPAVLLWGSGLEDRQARLTFNQPPEKIWRVATQLYPTADPLLFSAPNLFYLLDSPVEFSDFSLRTFSVPDPSDNTYVPVFRLAVHQKDNADLVTYSQSIEKIVREMVLVFGEFPRFETGTYTFIADYLPSATSDAMEHRNSTVLTSPRQLGRPQNQMALLGSVSHEFFHAWNVERIRPQSLEPFNFTGANVSGELWLAEGVTNYYGALILARSGLMTLSGILDRFAQTINASTLGPGRRFRSVVEMSRLAPFVDAATSVDPTNFNNTFISYYTWGEAVGLALDLALRVHSRGAVTLDDYMRRLWGNFGVPETIVPGVVPRPYSPGEIEKLLGVVANDPVFSQDFFDRYVNGREVIDYRSLFVEAGLVVRPVEPQRATLGELSLGTGLRLTNHSGYDTPLYNAGLARGDVIASIDGRSMTSRGQIDRYVKAQSPDDSITIGFIRNGERMESIVTLAPERFIEIVPLEATGQALSETQRLFRDAWLGSKHQ